MLQPFPATAFQIHHSQSSHYSSLYNHAVVEAS
jgi:hypothetical protein